MKPTFTAGKNMAMKAPPHEYDAVVAFYRVVLGFEQLDLPPAGDMESATFRFGAINLWVDKAAGLSQAEIWLEVTTDDVQAAQKYLADNGLARRDEIEPLPAGFKGFWLANPADIIHLICARGQ